MIFLTVNEIKRIYGGVLSVFSHIISEIMSYVNGTKPKNGISQPQTKKVFRHGSFLPILFKRY